MSKQPSTPKSPAVPHDSQAEKEAERAELALENVRKGYGDAQHDRANPSGANSDGDARDTAAGRPSGNP